MTNYPTDTQKQETQTDSAVTVRTHTISIQCPPNQRTWKQLAPRLRETLTEGELVRLICVAVEGEQLTFDATTVETDRKPVWTSLLDSTALAPSNPPDGSPWTVVSLIPTGIRAEVGGFAGDATPSTNLLATACDRLITNPNAVTASDLYCAVKNVSYLEGNLINRFMLGQLDLGIGEHRKVGLVVEEAVDPAFERNVLNAVNAMRTVAGIEVDPVVFTGRIQTQSVFAEHGHASGKYGDMNALLDALDAAYDGGARAVGVVSSIDVPQPVREAYYNNELIPNPWGSAEAILTHTATSYFATTAAHSPLLLEEEHTMFGTLGDPRDGAELISSAFLCSMVQGLATSPSLIPANTPIRNGENRISAEHVRAIVMPETAVGNIPFFSALDRNIPVILVRNPTTGQVTPERLGLLGQGHPLYIVENYLEAAGLLMALRNGIAPAALYRPISQIEPIVLSARK